MNALDHLDGVGEGVDDAEDEGDDGEDEADGDEEENGNEAAVSQHRFSRIDRTFKRAIISMDRCQHAGTVEAA